MQYKGTPCAFPGCQHTRKGFTQYCPKHERSRNLTGHPTGRILRTRDLAPYVSIAAEALSQYASSPPVKAAVALCDHLLQINSGDLGKQMARLREKFARGDELLQMMVTVWLYAHYNKRTLPDDIQLTMQVGHQLLHVRPLDRRAPYLPRGNRNPYLRPNSRTVRKLGELVRAKFGLFLLQLTALIEKQTETEVRLTQAVRNPIDNTEAIPSWS